MKTARKFHDEEDSKLIRETVFALLISPMVFVLAILGYCYSKDIETWMTDNAVIAGSSLILFGVIGSILFAQYLTENRFL